MKSFVDTVALCNASGLNEFDEATRKIIAAILENKDNLQVVVQEETTKITHQLAANEISAERRHEETLSAINGLSTRFSRLQIFPTQGPTDPATIFKEIKGALNYDRKDERYEDIKPPHQKTFEWIYETNDNKQLPWDSFGTWLREKGGIYWLCGKAGSGKSTLMKFLHRDSRTAELIKQWAGDTQFMVLSFYFWNLGTDLEKSTRGLYQSLLYDALKQNHELGPVLFPDRYTADAKWESFPTMNQLRQAYRLLVTQEIIPLKLVFHIDGLDEFEDASDNMEELTEMFISAVQQPNIKAILSSRPHQCFTEAFKDCAKLRLHELTRSDITAYIQDKIGQHPRIKTLSTESPTGTGELIREIVDSASGVFLWVKLVVRSLLEGLQNYDKLSDLQARLDELPKDLEALFKHMLGKIPNIYRIESSQIFQIVRCNSQAMKADNTLLSGPVELTALDLFFANLEPFSVCMSEIAPIQESYMLEKRAEVEARLRSRCAGLIELQSPMTKPSDDSQDQLAIFWTDLNPPVQFLHKSVADFLEDSDVWSEMVAPTKGTIFDPNVSILQSMVMSIKSFPCNKSSFGYSSPGLWLLR